MVTLPIISIAFSRARAHAQEITSRSSQCPESWTPGRLSQQPHRSRNWSGARRVTHSKTGANLREAPPVRVLHGPPGSNSARGSGANHLTVNERAGCFRGRSRGDEQPRTGSPTEEARAFPDPGVRAYSNALGGCVYDVGRNPRARDRCSGQETTGKPLQGPARIK